ncbi:MAG TPA: hypothetical protein VMY88_12260 [Acidimicrobiales bacterium]|nr:hypothetical protein [Acidimicrobiales bacterium]
MSLEVALVRATRPEASTDVSALAERVAKLERAVAAGATGAAAASAPPSSASAAAPRSARPSTTGPRAGEAPAQPVKSPLPSRPPSRGAAAPPPEAVPDQPAEVAPSGGEMPDRDLLTQAWGDLILASLPAPAKARLRTGRFTAVEGDTAIFALPNQPHVSNAEGIKSHAEDALSAHFGTKVRIRLVVDDTPGQAGSSVPAAPAPRGIPPAEEEVEVAIEDTVSADSQNSPEDVVQSAFPGAEEVDTP